MSWYRLNDEQKRPYLDWAEDTINDLCRDIEDLPEDVYDLVAHDLYNFVQDQIKNEHHVKKC